MASEVVQISFNDPSGELNGITFDAEFNIAVRGETQITGYPVETGFVVNNGIVNTPDIMRLKLGLGTQPLTNLVSKDALDSLTSSWTTYVRSRIVSIVPGGVATIIANQIANQLQSQLIEPSSRQGVVYTALQIARLTGQSLDIVIHNVGMLKGYLIKTCNMSRGDYSDVTFDVSLQQFIGKVGQTRTIPTASGPVDLGRLPIKQV